MTNPNQCGTKMWVSWSPSLPFIANMGELIGILRILVVPYSSIKTITQKQLTWETPKEKCTREDNKNVIQYYFKSNPTRSGFWKIDRNLARNRWLSENGFKHMLIFSARDTRYMEIAEKNMLKKNSLNTRYWKQKYHGTSYYNIYIDTR